MLQITQLNSGYGQSQVIYDANFKVPPGEILAIMGRNGMGKTTLLKSLIGILPTRSGSIKVGDAELAGVPPFQRVGAGMAYVPQGRMIFPTLSVLDNILTGAKGPMSKSAMDEIYALFPVLFEMRKRRGGNLSGGQQQQLAIARALASNPKVLILDEPTEGIQPSIIKDIARALKQIRQMRGLAIVVTEQVVSFMMDVCDRVLVMERGRFIHEELRKDVDANKVKALLAV
ncbi:MAG: urea ABC transporter ATP-binding subunit UrtE [Verrucomicrobiales bacterium]|jgi:urea transport system ATP-binding protein|nr:urea ABC transporter ATP-binding subunit UrtE [Verrucomicrobiales bacterium]